VSPLLVVFKKELRDMFRDKRVRTSAFFMPAVLIIGMLYLFGTMITSLKKTENQVVHVVQTTNPLLGKLIEKKFKIVEVASTDEAERLVKSGEARVVVDFGPPPATPDQPINIKVYLDPKQQKSEIIFGQIAQTYAAANHSRVAAYLETKGLPRHAQDLITVGKQDVAIGEKGGAGELLVGFLPYLIVVWAFWGGMGIVSDLVAGEKEKNTLETLLITPVRRTQIVLGKFLALSIVCLLSSMSSVIGLVLFALVKPPGSEVIVKEGLGVTGSAFGVILLVLLPTVALFASVLIAISSYAKNTREAQTHLAVVSFIVLMPAILVQFIGLTDMGRSMWINAVPVLNTGANIRAALLGQAEVVPVLMTVATSLILALVALKIAVWLFNREQVLTRV
jgi:sodium transport system permease protein